jgi:hypothetical protein
MPRLIYLMDEICNGVEIYYTGRVGGQYLKTAFILCDDYTELTSKLFLLAQDPQWSDRKANGWFKNYYDVKQDVRDLVGRVSAQHVPRVEELQKAMKERRSRRNDFFHSAHLLDLGVAPRNCVEAYCDLLDYGHLLFAEEWTRAVSSARNLDTLELLLRLEKKGFSDPLTLQRMSDILGQMPRNHTNRVPTKGVHVTKYPEDLHLWLSIVSGGPELRDKLAKLL